MARKRQPLGGGEEEEEGKVMQEERKQRQKQRGDRPRGGKPRCKEKWIASNQFSSTEEIPSFLKIVDKEDTHWPPLGQLPTIEPKRESFSLATSESPFGLWPGVGGGWGQGRF